MRAGHTFETGARPDLHDEISLVAAFRHPRPLQVLPVEPEVQHVLVAAEFCMPDLRLPFRTVQREEPVQIVWKVAAERQLEKYTYPSARRNPVVRQSDADDNQTNEPGSGRSVDQSIAEEVS